MPEVKYGGKQGTSYRLRASDELLAVRSRSGRVVGAGVVPRGDVSGGALEELLAFPEAGVSVLRRRAGFESADLDQLKRSFRSTPDTRFAGRVLVDEASGEPVLYTENLFIKFVDDMDPDDCLELLRDVGLTVKREVTYATNAWFVAAPEGTGQRVFEIAQELLDREDVELCHPELVRRIGRKAIAPQQWHLKATTINGQPVSASAFVEAAHAVTQGAGVTIAVIDDGFDLEHVEFSSPGKIVAARDVTRQSNNPRPGNGDDHGTACAGVACADGRFGASGVAPQAKLMPIRFASLLGSQAESDAFEWAANNGADVISCSWGPPDGKWFDPNDPLHRQVVPLPDSTRLAMEFAVTRGRGGKGCVIFFAAGNGNESVDNDGYASAPFVTAVAACNDRSRRSVYSDFGQAVFCSFPSNDYVFAAEGRPEPLTPGIWTTDRSGVLGYNFGDTRFGDAAGNFANDFGGTSSACPGAAGVAALVLSRNPNLRWDEVRDILKRSCDKIDPQGGNYQNGRSPSYGFGRLNAETAVRLATPQRPAEGVNISANVNLRIRDLQTTRGTLQVGDAAVLSKVKVTVDIEHTYIGDLIVKLVPPAATGVSGIVLHNRKGGATRNLQRTFDALNVAGLAGLSGKSAKGTWTLEVRDAAERDEGTLRSFGLELTFATPAPAVAPAARESEPSAEPAAAPRPRTRRTRERAGVK